MATNSRDFTLVVSFGRPIVGDFTSLHDLSASLGCRWEYIHAAREYRITGESGALATIASAFKEKFQCHVRVI